jgi:hypothetical protein
MAPQELDTEAKNMSAPEDKALVYLYRRKYFPTDEVSLIVKLDGEYAGSMIGGTYLMWLLTPGMHDLASVGTNTSTLAIDARPGETYYIWLETKWGPQLGWATRLGLGEVIPHSELLLVTEETGRERVMESRLLEGRDFYRSEPP